ncbi:GNAT family N-acetyltransferase [Paenibacillus puldeungensis]|uniref:GNAT family N-acetyltransferase n=1 Tax=Paenibacillus puldeungensis TaxID=696536 RepID=A0ABW3RZI1_9BACL
MKKITQPWIKLVETLNRDDYERIHKLEEECTKDNAVALKLELDYKLAATSDAVSQPGMKNINEFMFFDGPELIGYMGINAFGGGGMPIEVNGMVHPEYRRQGVFKRLSELVIAEWKRGKAGSMLLLSDRKSEAGQQFIRGTGAKYEHTEYEMYLRNDDAATPTVQQLLPGLTFRKATNADALEINRQNAIYFGEEFDTTSDEPEFLPEEEEKRGMTIYFAEYGETVIGKIHLELHSGLGGIYGLGVLPEYRGKGFGRAILTMGVHKLKEAGANEVMLQVAVNNANALHLYQSCGFVETSTMDYYELRADK